MSAPLRFLGVAIILYVGLRTASNALALQPLPVAMLPAAAPMSGQHAAMDTLPPGVAADMGPAVQAQPLGYAPSAGMPPGWPAYGMPYPVMMPGARQGPPIIIQAAYPQGGYPVPRPAAWRETEGEVGVAPIGQYPLPSAAGVGYEGSVPPIEAWPAIGTAGPFSVPQVQRTPNWGETGDGGALAAARVSRFSLDAWALLRPPPPQMLSVTDPARGLNPGLASAGALGGSQAGLRLTWRPFGRFGVHARASTALMPQGRSGQATAGGEGALGVSWQPLASLPMRIAAERRQRLGPALGGGRDAFALYAEGGVYDRMLPFGIRLDGYGQAGVVGWNSRDLFADGALAATYPLLPRIAIGGGMWGGVQPGLSRFDAGPRLSYQLHPRLRVHVDYRFRVTGNADPASGPAVTLSGGF